MVGMAVGSAGDSMAAMGIIGTWMAADGMPWVGRGSGMSASTAPLEQQENHDDDDDFAGLPLLLAGTGSRLDEPSAWKEVLRGPALMPPAITGAHSMEVTGGVVRRITFATMDSR